MDNNDQVSSELPHLHDHKSLSLHWRSFEYIVQSTSAAVDNGFHSDLSWSADILPDWDSALWQSREA